ncbi:hypothetical protein GRX03_12375 [Halovenus sp. WSH3]|uniref:Uncharacterized protein n=1 Tax=Halovenus carboxidivorans TaxID=2692199 RepID=A0A6B0T860_9EURY|nr:hypothetical protein [Halovenus carboxidivorans]MXR52396.1 hypothetical protein [Halovenus carboxidivorans]
MSKTRGADKKNQSKTQARFSRRNILATSIAAVAGTAGCLNSGEADNDDNNNSEGQDEADIPEVSTTEIEFVDSNGESINNLAQVKVRTDQEVDPENLSGTVQVETLDNQIPLEFTETREGRYVSQELEIQAETTVTAELQPGNQIDGDQGDLQSSTEYQLTQGTSVQQTDSAPGIIEARLEPDNSTAGSLENLAAEELEATAQVNGQTQNITLHPEYTENENGEQEFNGYTALVNVVQNGKIREDVEIQIGEIDELEGFRLEDGKLTLTGEQAQKSIDSEEFISAEEAYEETYSDGAPISEDDLDQYQNGEIQDFGELLKEINAKAPTFGDANQEDKATEVYKQVGHNLLDLDRDQYRVIKRSATSGVDYFTVFYRKDTSEDWNKALGRGRNYEEADTTILLPEMETEDLTNSVLSNLHGLHNREDPTNASSIDFQQVTDIFSEFGVKQEYSEDEWSSRLENLDEYNDLLIPGGGEIGYTADVRGHMQDLINPRGGDVGAELELVEAASEYFHNAVPEDQFMQIDIDTEGEGEGEKLIETGTGEAFYATTVNQETHEENFMALYDPDVAS